MNKEDKEEWIKLYIGFMGLIILGIPFQLVSVYEIPRYFEENINLFLIYAGLWLISLIISLFFIAIGLGITTWKEIKNNFVSSEKIE